MLKDDLKVKLFFSSPMLASETAYDNAPFLLLIENIDLNVNFLNGINLIFPTILEK